MREQEKAESKPVPNAVARRRSCLLVEFPENPSGVSMTRQIPVPVIAVVSEVMAGLYTHNQIDNFLEATGIELPDVPPGNKEIKVRAWLKYANETHPDPVGALGKAIVELMEVYPVGWPNQVATPYMTRVNNALNEYGFIYLRGGRIISSGTTAVGENLQEIIHNRSLSGLETEFKRIYENLDADPPSAVTASSALLEALFKTYIEENGLEMPAEESIKPLWKVVRKDLRLDPALVNDDDLKTILTGLAAIVEGTGSLRTHKGSAHGRGKTAYKLKPRHARLAAHAAFTLASFVLEAWGEREG